MMGKFSGFAIQITQTQQLLLMHVMNKMAYLLTDQATVCSYSKLYGRTSCLSSIQALRGIEVSVVFQYTNVSQCHFSVI